MAGTSAVILRNWVRRPWGSGGHGGRGGCAGDCGVVGVKSADYVTQALPLRFLCCRRWTNISNAGGISEELLI